MNPPPGRRRRSTAALLCVALLADDATAIRAYQCCASSSSRRRSRLASPRLCDERQVLGDPATILGFGEALRQGDVSPQLEPGSMPPTISRGIDGLEVLRPARDYKNRHASILLTLEALVEAMEEVQAQTSCA